MGCAMGTVRYILFFFNFLLALAGLGILIIGVITARAKGITLDSVSAQLSTPAIVFSIIGACVFIFAFFGCCGALRESHCMVCTYALLLLTLFLLQVAVAVLAYVYSSQTEDAISTVMKQKFDKYSTDPPTKEWVDNFQQNFQCCGSTDPNTPWGVNIPQSCYPDKNQGSTRYSEGCVPKLVNFVKDALTEIGQIAIAVGVIEVLGIIFALCLANSIRRSELRGYA